MDKKIIFGVVLILLAGSGWLYLDYLNKQNQLAAEEMHKAMVEARAQAKARFETQLRTDLSFCQEAAERAKKDYIEQNQKPVPRKPGEFAAPQIILDEAANKQAAANAQCQQAYDTHLKNGF
jgi:hypothetical protein